MDSKQKLDNRPKASFLAPHAGLGGTHAEILWQIADRVSGGGEGSTWGDGELVIGRKRTPGGEHVGPGNGTGSDDPVQNQANVQAGTAVAGSGSGVGPAQVAGMWG